MKISPDDIAVLAQLADEYVDLTPAQQGLWLEDAARKHPSLADALRAMGDHNALPLSLPQLSGLPPDEHDRLADGVDDDSFAVGDSVGPYRLVRKLGQGGMGVVWLAEQADGHVERTVALKLPLQRMDQRGLLARFQRERNILAALDHPGIAKLFDAGVTASGQPYMAMQYVSGVSLTQYCNQHRLDVPARLKLFIELLDAVQHAHSALVIHRDLKPGNILVTDAGRVVLLDFGVAKLLDTSPPAPEVAAEPLTEFAATALTVDYASPEQVAGRLVGTSSDIYSLGVVLYELLVGRRPYRLRRNSRSAMEDAVLEQEVQRPSARVEGPKALARQLRGDLDAIVLKALMKRPESRYATAREFASDLYHWLHKEPVSAQPDRMGYRFGRLLRRRWKLVAASTAVALLLVATTIVALLQAAEANRSSQLARDEARKAQAVTAFMQDLFIRNSIHQSDPQAARSRTAEQLLDEGALRLQGELRDAPELQLKLMHVIAMIYLEMRLPHRSVDLAEKSVAVARASYGDQDPRTLQAWADLAVIAFSVNEHPVGAKALRHVESALTALVASKDAGHRLLAARVFDAMLSRDVFNDVGKSIDVAKQAEQLFATLPATEYHWNRHHILGVAYLKNQRFKEAQAHYAECMAQLERIGGKGGDGTPYSWYGMLQAMQGNYAAAQTHFRQGYSVERRSDARNALVSGWAIAHYARYFLETSRPTEALALVQTGGEEAGPILREVLGKAFRVQLAKGSVRIRMGQVEQGLAHVDEAYALALAEIGEAQVHGWVPIERAEAALALGRLEEAQAFLDTIQVELHGNGAEFSTDARSYWRNRVELLLAQGRALEARATLEQSRSTLQPEGAGLVQQATVQWLEAGVDQLEGRYEDAKTRAVRMLARIAASPDRIYLREWEARLTDALGTANAALGDLDGAQLALESALSQYEAIFDGQTSLVLGRVAFSLAGVHQQSGRHAAAALLRARALQIQRQHPLFQAWMR
ncbi:MAG: hypothetical protein CFE44_13210 [Burkholderiales bacterium PBB4]|nr:MAG: hypothetical protein CFE44_13210 [Burkholderiales bacterium PBB4]